MLWAVYSLLERLKNQKNYLQGLRKTPASIWGMSVAHFGIAVFVIGVAHVNTYSQEKDIKLSPGETYTLGDYEFRFDGVRRIKELNYTADEGKFIVAIKPNKNIELAPQKRQYATGLPMTEAAINTTVSRDLYVSLGEDLGDGAWSVRFYFRSFVACIWLGGLLMALGGLIATTDRRYRRPVKRVNKHQLAEMT